MISPTLLQQFTCLSCRSLGTLETSATQAVCRHCQKSYPFVQGKYLVLLNDAEGSLSQAYKEYATYVGQQEMLVQRLLHKDVRSAYRSMETRTQLAQGIALNTEMIRDIQAQIKPYTDLDKVAITRESHDLNYLSNFDYIRRDWSGQQAAEQEIATIVRIAEELIREHATDLEHAVFLGSGTARVAWELKDVFGACFSLDNAITMVAMFNELMHRDLQLSEINYTNVADTGNNSVPYTASLTASSKKASPDFFHFVGDARFQPFADQSVSVLCSIYFTDLLPLRILLPELKRVLKPGGLFFHFGPLHYHFPDIEDMLTAGEVKEAFLQEGFELLHEAWMPLSHHASTVSLSRKSYHNWIVVFRKKEAHKAALSFDTVLKVDKGLRYSSGGSIGQGQDEPEQTSLQIILPSGDTFSGSELILELARRVDGERSLHDIVSGIEQEFDIVIEDREELLNMVGILLQGGVFRF